MRSWLIVASALIVSWCATSASASVFVPAGLNPGDTYHLVFATSGTTQATSSNIATYNAFVQAQATLAGAFTEDFGVTWFAVGSTETVDARDNAVVSAPVYLLDGTQVAVGFADLWDGSISAAIDLTQFLNTLVGPEGAWTGTLPDGTKDEFFELGSAFDFPTIGEMTANDSFWIYGFGSNSTELFHMYALSDLLTVPFTSVPEPNSLLLGVGMFGACVWGVRRRRSASRRT